MHYPLGILSLLFLVWVIKQGIDVAPFRFPAAVLAMAVFFFLLLLLDWLSIKFPGDDQAASDPEQAGATRGSSDRRRFVEPLMKLLAPPCDFCLRNMSVMFTPSFILIPAREIIPGKEIGILTAWFTITQVIAYVIPVVLNWGVGWAWKQPARLRAKREADRQSRISQSRRGSQATLAGGDQEKGFAGGHRLSTIATGLSGLTAIVTNPVERLTRYRDEKTQLTHVQIETARQQGDPAVSTDAEIASLSGSPLEQWDGFHAHHHPHRHHHPLPHPNPPPPGTLRRGRSVTRADSLRRQTSSGPRVRSESPNANTSRLARFASPIRRPKASPLAPSSLRFESPRTQDTPQMRIVFDDHLPTAASERAADATAVPTAVTTPHNGSLEEIEVYPEENIVQSRRPSRADSQVTINDDTADDGTKKKDGKDEAATSGDEESETPADDDNQSSCEQDAVERLSEWIADLITPVIYLVLFIVGIPLFFIYNFALPLFLAINLLTFLAAISIVPPKIRRYLHPILSTSIATVFIIWAFGEMKGYSLAGVLGYYSNGAKYTVLWDVAGYRGPVPGAGDVLFSTLDAGIVALAVPMYRYRRDLRENFWRMMAVLTPCAALSLFVWPWIGALMGLDSVRALAFSARFMSTPLAIEMALNVGADESITVIIVVVTGIVAAILKEPFFRMLRVSMDDHIAVGIAMGSTSGAIGASSLISRPRVMAVASLAFVLFGTLLLICAAIPQIVDVVRHLAGADGPVIPPM